MLTASSLADGLRWEHQPEEGNTPRCSGAQIKVETGNKEAAHSQECDTERQGLLCHWHNPCNVRPLRHFMACSGDIGTDVDFP